MRKIESTRTLCDYYNEIVYKVEQLTEMCGNTDEAIKLRDDIYDMFTVKFSEPLDDVSELQEELGCPLDVFFKAFDGMYIIDDWHQLYFAKPVFINGKFKIEQHYGVYDAATYFLDPKDYKKTWWLKKNREE